MDLPKYDLPISETCFNTGFFNLGIKVNDFIRHDEGPIDILLGETSQTITAKVNRSANPNKTPRIMGGTELKYWFQDNFKIGDVILVEIISPFKIRLVDKYKKQKLIKTADTHQDNLLNQDSNISIEKNFQRKGSRSNAHVGKEFEKKAKLFFLTQGVELDSNYKIEIGVSQIKKDHVFDLGSDNPKIIVECKSHRWTETDKIPSAKRTVWNEAMFYFFIAPKEYRKIFFVLKHFSPKWNETLASYYVRLYAHLIPHGVEIWEYDEEIETALKIY